MSAHARVPGPTDHVVVVGAGLAGLATALHLAGAGRRVTVVERGDRPGGRSGLLTSDGYRVDTGPTVLTMPDVLAEAFAAAGRRMDEHLELRALDPAYHARFADGSELAVRTDPTAMEDEVRSFAGPAEARGYRQLRAWLAELYGVERDRFIGSNFDSPLDLARPELARLAALGGFGRLGPRIARFLSDERLQRVFSFQSLYVGVPPQRALAAYAVIAYMDTVTGVYFPSGGVHAVPRAMATAAEEAGVRFRYGTEVTSLERGGARVTAVRAADERIPCDAVVLTTELPDAYRLLGRRPRRPVGLRWSPSAVLLHRGVSPSRATRAAAHHTLSFGGAWERTFTEITRSGQLMSDPSLLVTRPTATDPTLAPVDRESVSVLAPCPNLRVGGVDWPRVAPAYREELLRILERRCLPGAEPDAEMEFLVTPREWACRGYPAGTPFGAAHTLAQTGPFRPRNLVSGVDNAVLAGGSTVPGVGVPVVLLSGKLAAQRITG